MDIAKNQKSKPTDLCPFLEFSNEPHYLFLAHARPSLPAATNFATQEGGLRLFLQSLNWLFLSIFPHFRREKFLCRPTTEGPLKDQYRHSARSLIRRFYFELEDFSRDQERAGRALLSSWFLLSLPK